MVISTGYEPRALYSLCVQSVLLKEIEEKERKLVEVKYASLKKNMCAKMTEAEKYRIPLFDGSNFGNWKFRIETLLTELELLELTEKPYTERVEFLATDRPEEKLLKNWRKSLRSGQERTGNANHK